MSGLGEGLPTVHSTRRTHAHTHVYMHIYTHIYTHVYRHVYTHVYTHVRIAQLSIVIFLVSLFEGLSQALPSMTILAALVICGLDFYGNRLLT